jgi:hypothetical protein
MNSKTEYRTLLPFQFKLTNERMTNLFYHLLPRLELRALAGSKFFTHFLDYSKIIMEN